MKTSFIFITGFSLIYFACCAPCKYANDQIIDNKTISRQFLGTWIRKDYVDALKNSPTLIESADSYEGISSLEINEPPEKSFYSIKFNEGDKCIFEVLSENLILLRDQYREARVLYKVALNDSNGQATLSAFDPFLKRDVLQVKYSDDYSTLDPPYELVNEIFIEGMYVETSTGATLEFSRDGRVMVNGKESSKFCLSIPYCDPPYFDWIKFHRADELWLTGMFHVQFRGDTLKFFDLREKDGLETISNLRTTLIRKER